MYYCTLNPHEQFSAKTKKSNNTVILILILLKKHWISENLPPSVPDQLMKFKI